MHGTVQWIFSTAASSTSPHCWWDHHQITGTHLLLATPVISVVQTWQGRFLPGNHPGVLVAMYLLQVHVMLFPSSLPLLFVNDRDPPFVFPPLDQLISAGFGTKIHLGETTCQLRSVFTQKRHLLLNICLQGSKTFLLSPLNTLSIFLVAYRSRFFAFSTKKPYIQ